MIVISNFFLETILHHFSSSFNNWYELMICALDQIYGMYLSWIFQFPFFACRVVSTFAKRFSRFSWKETRPEVRKNRSTNFCFIFYGCWRLSSYCDKVAPTVFFSKSTELQSFTYYGFFGSNISNRQFKTPSHERCCNFRLNIFNHLQAMQKSEEFCAPSENKNAAAILALL